MSDDPNAPKAPGYGPEAIEILRGLGPPVERPSLLIGGEIEWSRCPDAESVPDRGGGAWVAKNSRVPVQAILDNADDATAAEIAARIELPVEQVRRILDFALAHPPPLMFGEGEPTALLLAMVLQHCGTAQPDELDSYATTANADAMAALAESGHIAITTEFGRRITGRLTFSGRLLLASLRATQEQRPQ